MNKKQYLIIIISTIIVLSFLFYWHEWRPSQARINCAIWTMEQVKNESTGTYKTDEYDHVYKMCLQRKGF